MYVSSGGRRASRSDPLAVAPVSGGADGSPWRACPTEGQAVACPLCLPRWPAEAPGSGGGRRPSREARCEAPLRLEGRPPILACPRGTAHRGGERGGWGRCTGVGSWLAPLPGSYSRVGSAGRLFAGRCPSLTARVGSLKTFTGIIPAAACVSRYTASLRAGRQSRHRGEGSGGHLSPYEAGQLAGDRYHGDPGRLAAGGHLLVLACSRSCAFHERASVSGAGRPAGASVTRIAGLYR